MGYSQPILCEVDCKAAFRRDGKAAVFVPCFFRFISAACAQLSFHLPVIIMGDQPAQNVFGRRNGSLSRSVNLYPLNFRS